MKDGSSYVCPVKSTIWLVKLETGCIDQRPALSLCQCAVPSGLLTAILLRKKLVPSCFVLTGVFVCLGICLFLMPIFEGYIFEENGERVQSVKCLLYKCENLSVTSGAHTKVK